MTLQEAIELVGVGVVHKPYEQWEVQNGEFSARLSLAIATILNAVVKGELRYDEE